MEIYIFLFLVSTGEGPFLSVFCSEKGTHLQRLQLFKDVNIHGIVIVGKLILCFHNFYIIWLISFSNNKKVEGEEKRDLKYQ